MSLSLLNLELHPLSTCRDFWLSHHSWWPLFPFSPFPTPPAIVQLQTLESKIPKEIQFFVNQEHTSHLWGTNNPIKHSDLYRSYPNAQVCIASHKNRSTIMGPISTGTLIGITRIAWELFLSICFGMSASSRSIWCGSTLSMTWINHHKLPSFA